MISRRDICKSISTSPLRCVPNTCIFVHFAWFCSNMQENMLRTWIYKGGSLYKFWSIIVIIALWDVEMLLQFSARLIIFGLRDGALESRCSGEPRKHCLRSSTQSWRHHYKLWRNRVSDDLLYQGFFLRSRANAPLTLYDRCAAMPGRVHKFVWIDFRW